MGHEDDVRCLVGEEVPGYHGFYRPAGGHSYLVPRKTCGAGEEEAAPVFSRKSWAYIGAEMAGRKPAAQ